MGKCPSMQLSKGAAIQQALKVRTRARNRKRTIANFSREGKPRATQNISREYRKM